MSLYPVSVELRSVLKENSQNLLGRFGSWPAASGRCEGVVVGSVVLKVRAGRYDARKGDNLR